ncbi:MAG: GNAT family N-acetyltransferase [Armatimonadetes bacterium]|nr:GNAT family N-acetyltransferase [Armatimonadota bacterium]
MQLVMMKHSLEGLPPVELPQGYELRHFVPGDEAGWEAVMAASFGQKEPAWSFRDVMGRDAACSPERVLLVTCRGQAVATASAWYRPEWGIETGYVHYVAADPAHSGKKLGHMVSLAVLHRFVFEGRTRAVLQTDDFRAPAIKTYLRLGFEPWLVEEDQRQRWRVVFETNRLQPLCPNWEEIIKGSIHTMPGA